MDAEMIERVAKAIRLRDTTDEYAMARAAIKAMREPTEHMYEYLSGHGPVWRDQTSYGVWTTYIDAIIKE